MTENQQDKEEAERWWQQAIRTYPYLKPINDSMEERIAELDTHIAEGEKIREHKNELSQADQAILEVGLALYKVKKEMIEADSMNFMSTLIVSQGILNELRGRTSKAVQKIARETTVRTIEAMIQRNKAKKEPVKTANDVFELLWASQKKRGMLT